MRALSFSTSGLFGFGPALMELRDAGRAHNRTRIITSLYASVLHAALALAWDWKAGWWLAGATVLHAAIIQPLTRTQLFSSPAVPLVVDGMAVVASGIIAGSAAMVAPWAPLLVFSAMTFLPTKRALAALVYAVATVPLAAVGVALLSASTPPTNAQLAIYPALVVPVYVMSVGALIMLVGSEMRQREATDRLRLRQLEVLSKLTNVGMAIVDHSGRYVFSNPRFEEVLQLEAVEINSHTVGDTVPAPVRHLVQPELDRALRKGTELDIQHPLRLPDRSERWVHTHMSRPIPGPFDEPWRVITLTDITDQVVARLRHRHITRAWDSISDLAAWWDEDGNLLYSNDAFGSFFDIDQGGIPLPILDVLDEAIPDWLEITEGAEVEAEVELTSADGRLVPMSLLVLVIAQPDGRRAYAGVARDITTQRTVRTQLEGLVRDKDQFIASVSHELRTPLTVVLGLASELADALETFDDSEIRDFVQLIANQAGEVTAIVEDLLTAARADAGVLTITTVDASLRSAVDQAMTSIPPDHRSGIEIRGDDVAATIDPGRVRQIVRNLLTNAVRYGGPHIVVEVGADGDGRAYIEVSDDGDEIPSERRSHMFAAYGRAHSTNGTPDSVGLGLTVSRSLARLMGGDVVYDHDGRWSRFLVTLGDAFEPSRSVA